MPFYTYYILGFLCKLSYKNDNFKLKEPFDGLFTQGMVCHETYKDQTNAWLSPDEVTSEDGKQFYKKDNLSEKVIVGPTESMSKSKKNTIDPENIIKIMEQILLDYLFYQIVLQKKMCNGLIKV